ncbi:MAG TPA: hypothetical protein VMC03_15850 [Streptosporangiaceae bacterium]|nr:hypothetical protein [Streptosporangiaceae bacterium]
MQLIEQTGFGVRSAMLTFARPGSAVRFTLFPMLHPGSPAFYQAVRRRLSECDVVVIEGVGGKTTSVITLAYRLGGRVRRGGLVGQGRGLDLAGLRRGRARCPRPSLVPELERHPSGPARSAVGRQLSSPATTRRPTKAIGGRR